MYIPIDYTSKIMEVGKKMSNYQGVSLPKKLLNQIDENLENSVYISKADFIRQAIRHEIERVCRGKK